MATRLRMGNPTEIKRTLARIGNMTLRGEIEPKQANSIIYSCNSILSAIKVIDQQEKIDELEQMIEEIER